MDAQTADAIYSILVKHAGETDHDGHERAAFIYHQTRGCTEYRFMGALGFGGKFWVTLGRRPDGTWGERWFINTYRELMTPVIESVIDTTNNALAELQGTTVKEDAS